MYKAFLITGMALGILIPGAHAADYAVPVVESSAEIPVYPSSSSQSGVNTKVAQESHTGPGFIAPQSTPRRAPEATPLQAPEAYPRRTDQLYQIEMLQQEVQTLRGMVEEQAYLLQQMREEQRDRYLDLDRRISLITSSDIPSGQSSTTAASQSPDSIATAPNANANEKNAFDEAFNLIRMKQYDNAIASLKQFTQDYPDGLYTANAYYWLGEVEIVKANLEGALAAFAQLIEKYPQHRKIPDAKYKQGKLYRRLGDTTKATQVLEEVISQHPGTSAAKLAESELQSLKSAS